MDNQLLLVKSITLLYRESHLPGDANDSSADLVRTILESIKVPEVNLTLNHEKDQLSALKTTALHLCSQAGTEIDKHDLLQRLKVNCGDNDKIYEAFAQGIDREMEVASLKRTVLAIRKSLNDSFKENEIIKMVRLASTDLTFNREKIKNLRTFVQDLCARLEPYTVESAHKDPAIVGNVDLGDDGSMREAFEEVKANDSPEGIMRTGWQGINEMTQGGARRGEQWVLPALQHKYKTGFTLSLFKQFAIYNKPHLIDATKKPLLLRISFEDNLATNLRYLYENIYFNQHYELPDVKNISAGTVASYVTEHMRVNGFHIKMMRVNPSEWNYKSLQNIALEMEASGYEVVLMMVDYLPMIPTIGCEDGPSGHALRDLYRRTRNFFSARKTIFITPHQLSTDAKQLVRDGHSDFVKLLPGKGYYAGSKQIDQEVDLEMYLHIEKFNKRAFLTVQRGKHRGVPVISEDKMYTILPFPEVGPIPDDLGKARIDSSKLGGGPKGSLDEVPFFEFDQ